jgi:hypothetical protein
MAKRNYINPKVIAGTMEVLERYKAMHPQDKTPMANACAGEPITERQRYVRAAQRLGWSVVRSNGHVYENGTLIW